MGATVDSKHLHSSDAVLAVLRLRGDTADLLAVSPPQPGHVPWLGGVAGPDAPHRQVDRLVQLNSLRLASTFARGTRGVGGGGGGGIPEQKISREDHVPKVSPGKRLFKRLGISALCDITTT